MNAPQNPIQNHFFRQQHIASLALALADSPQKEEQLIQRLTASTDSWQDSTVTLLSSCAELVAKAETFRDSSYITAMHDRCDAKTRRVMLQIMHQAVYNSSWDDAGLAVDTARRTDVKALFDVLATDAITAAAFGVAMTEIAAVGTVGVGATTSALVKAYKAGTVVGKAKAVLWGTAAVGIGGLAIGAGLIATSVFLLARESHSPERRACFATELGKDLIFIEILTGHRYTRGNELRMGPPAALRRPDVQHIYTGGMR